MRLHLNMNDMQNQNLIPEEAVSFPELLSKTGKNLKKMAPILIIGAIMGGLIGLGLFYSGEKRYKVEMVGYSNSLTDDLAGNLLDELSLMVREKDYGLLAQKLNLKPEEASSIRGFGIRLNNQLDATATADEAAKGRNFAISITVADRELVKKLIPSLTYFFDNQAIAKLENQTIREGFKKVLERIDDEIESGKKARQSILEGKSAAVADLGEMERAMYELADKRIEAERNYRNYEHDLVVIKDFTLMTKQTSPRLIISTVTFGIYGLLAGLVLSIAFPKLRKKLG